MIHQFQMANQGTVWVQRIDRPVQPMEFQLVLTDTAPTTSPYNFGVFGSSRTRNGCRSPPMLRRVATRVQPRRLCLLR